VGEGKFIKYFDCVFRIVLPTGVWKMLHVDVPELLIRHHKEYHPVISSFFDLKVKPMKVKLLVAEDSNFKKFQQDDFEGSDDDNVTDEERRQINECVLFPLPNIV
jgi:hypothetical protein